MKKRAIAPELTAPSGSSPNARFSSTASSSNTSVTSVASASSASSVPPARPDPRLRFFEFVRGLKALQRDADPVTLRSRVAAWHKQDDRTSDFDTTTWLEFLEAWASVTCPRGVDAFDEALRRVDTGEQAPQAEGHPPNIVRLISVCWLMRSGPRARFFLSSRDAGLAMLPPDRRTEAAREDNASNGWRAMRYLEQHLGIVECLNRGTPGPKGKAARYSYTTPPEAGASKS